MGVFVAACAPRERLESRPTDAPVDVTVESPVPLPGVELGRRPPGPTLEGPRLSRIPGAHLGVRERALAQLECTDNSCRPGLGGLLVLTQERSEISCQAIVVGPSLAVTPRHCLPESMKIGGGSCPGVYVVLPQMRGSPSPSDREARVNAHTIECDRIVGVSSTDGNNLEPDYAIMSLKSEAPRPHATLRAVTHSVFPTEGDLEVITWRSTSDGSGRRQQTRLLCPSRPGSLFGWGFRSGREAVFHLSPCGIELGDSGAAVYSGGRLVGMIGRRAHPNSVIERGPDLRALGLMPTGEIHQRGVGANLTCLMELPGMQSRCVLFTPGSLEPALRVHVSGVLQSDPVRSQWLVLEIPFFFPTLIPIDTQIQDRRLVGPRMLLALPACLGDGEIAPLLHASATDRQVEIAGAVFFATLDADLVPRDPIQEVPVRIRISIPNLDSFRSHLGPHRVSLEVTGVSVPTASSQAQMEIRRCRN